MEITNNLSSIDFKVTWTWKKVFEIVKKAIEISVIWETIGLSRYISQIVYIPAKEPIRETIVTVLRLCSQNSVNNE